MSDPALDHVVESLSESKEELEVEDEKKKETTIKVSEQEIKGRKIKKKNNTWVDKRYEQTYVS